MALTTTISDKKLFCYATVAPMGEYAYRAVRQYLDDFYTIGPPDVLYMYDPLSDELAKEAAKLLNCHPDEITYLKNTTEGIHIASEALPLKPGDEVLVMGNEYPANLLSWLRKRKDGVIVTVIKGTDNVRAFQALMDTISPKTKAISVSSTQYYDGYTADLEYLAKTCSEKGIYLVIDAVQTVGVRKIDLQQLSVDIFVCGGQKYLQAGPGTGFMYVNRKTLGKLNDVKVGIRSMERFDEDSYALKPTTARFQDGTQNLPGIVALLAALKHVNELGIEAIEAKNKQLLAEIKSCLTRYDIPFIDHGENQGNIVSMKVNDPVGLTNYLKQHSVYVKPIKDVVRLSFIHETSIDDVEELARLTREWIDNHQSLSIAEYK
ncbi:MAG TPA: aminotransferase class V-fold PLP-dependent enzyme [Candidatus Saccharimonadales bacterium]|nr:aminotransferase class V-fold PLP-dependent enzyme [Candidatus Saccharimonadales bacterium]